MDFISALDIGAGVPFLVLRLEAFFASLLTGSSIFLLKALALEPPAARVRISDLLKATGPADACDFFFEVLFDVFLVAAITKRTFLPNDHLH